jgi:Flp pilus assembly protein TadD
VTERGEVLPQAGGDGAAALLQQGHALIDLRRFGDAVRVLQRAIAADPTRTRAWCLLAQALHADGRDAEALDAADRATATAPNHEWCHRLRSLALWGLHRREESVAAAQEAVRCAPDEPRAHHVLAGVALDAGLMETARAAAVRCVELAPDQAFAWGVLGRLRLKEDKPKDAEQAFVRAVSIDPHDAVVLNNLGVAQLRQGHWKPALSCFAQSARTDPTLELPVQNIERVMRSVPRTRVAVSRAWRFVFIPYAGAAIVAVAVMVQVVDRSIRWAALHRELKRALPPQAIRMLDLRVRAAVPLWPPMLGVLAAATLALVEGGKLGNSHGSDVAGRLSLVVFGTLGFLVNATLLLRRLSARRRRR